MALANSYYTRVHRTRWFRRSLRIIPHGGPFLATCRWSTSIESAAKHSGGFRAVHPLAFSRQGRMENLFGPILGVRAAVVTGGHGDCREEPLTRGRRASRRLARANSAYPRLPFLVHEKPIARARPLRRLRRPLRPRENSEYRIEQSLEKQQPNDRPTGIQYRPKLIFISITGQLPKSHRTLKNRFMKIECNAYDARTRRMLFYSRRL